jgi:hypothetical protein
MGQYLRKVGKITSLFLTWDVALQFILKPSFANSAGQELPQHILELSFDFFEGRHSENLGLKCLFALIIPVPEQIVYLVRNKNRHGGQARMPRPAE